MQGNKSNFCFAPYPLYDMTIFSFLDNWSWRLNVLGYLANSFIFPLKVVIFDFGIWRQALMDPPCPLGGRCCNYQPMWKKRTASSTRTMIGTLFSGYLPGNHIFLSAKHPECSSGPLLKVKIAYGFLIHICHFCTFYFLPNDSYLLHLEWWSG